MRVSKLEKLKGWLSIEDAAKRLSSSAGEGISEADILRLGLDGHLTLSVYFVNPMTGVLRGIESLETNLIECVEPPAHKTAEELQALFDRDANEFHSSIDQSPSNWVTDLLGIVYDDGRHTLQRLEGVWDLPMFGKEKLEVQREYQRLTGGVVVNPCCSGQLVKKHGNPELFEIFRRDSEEEYYHPATSFLDDGMLVVRTAVLQEFEEQHLCVEESEKEMKPSRSPVNAWLLELLMDDNRPRYTQDSIAEAINARHPDCRGSSKSNLTKLFAESKAAAKDADKVAQAKADARQASGSRITASKAETV